MILKTTVNAVEAMLINKQKKLAEELAQLNDTRAAFINSIQEAEIRITQIVGAMTVLKDLIREVKAELTPTDPTDPQSESTEELCSENNAAQ